jgi:hypothetical protein
MVLVRHTFWINWFIASRAVEDEMSSRPSNLLLIVPLLVLLDRLMHYLQVVDLQVNLWLSC